MRKKNYKRMFPQGNYVKKKLLIMKLLSLFLTASLIQLSANSYSQNAVINLENSSNHFGEIIKAIEEQSEFKVFYKNEQIDLERPIELAEGKANVQDVLMASLTGTDLKYTMIDKVIVLSPKNEAVKNIKQNTLVQGTVTNIDGEGLPGVNVVVKGTTIGTVTDIDGLYSINADPTATLMFTFIGFLPEEIVVGTQTQIDMQMMEDLIGLSEVVVVGYGTVKKSDVTGSVTSIRSEDLEQGNANNPMQAMQGKAAGVDITSNARPGEIGNIRIRGERSIGGTSEPLYVVDGIPMAQTDRTLNFSPKQVGASLVYENLGHNPIAHMNPSDIESIEILKDASATAIYGSRASNGVVLITTKRGRSGKAEINYDVTYTIEKLDDRIEMFDGPGLLESYREGIRYSSKYGRYTTPYPNPKDDLGISYLQQDYNAWLSVADAYTWEDRSAEDPADWVVKMRPTTAEEKAMWGDDVTEVPMYDPSKVGGTNWMDYAVQTGLSQNHQIGASMGNDKFNTYLSFGYLDHKGVQIGQQYDRFTSMVTMDGKITNKIRIGGSINGMFSDQEYGINTLDRARAVLPFATAYDTAGNYIYAPGGDFFMPNFIKDIDEEVDNRKTYHMRGSFYGEVDIVEGLKFRTNFGPDFREYRWGQFQSAETSSKYSADGGTSFGRYFQDQTFNWILENLLYYNKNLGNKVDLGVTVLHSAEHYSYEYSHISALDLTTKNQLWYDLGSTRVGMPDDFGSNYEKETRESYMGRLNLGFFDKYLITASGRWDGASVLAPGHKWSFFPSIAFAWKMQNEPFLSSSSAISESKLRIGYGVTGNSAIGPYQATGSLLNQNYNFGGRVATGVAINRPPNYLLGWEKTAQLNVGYDFGLWQGRVQGSVDVYKANTTDLLLDKLIPVVNGADQVIDNIGSTESNGIELSLSTINVSTSDFRWRTQFTFSKNKNKITSLLDDKNDLVADRWFIGEPIRVNYGFVYDGIWQATAEDSAMYEQYYGSPTKVGTIRVKDYKNEVLTDVDGNDSIVYAYDEKDMVVRGTPYPDFIAGMTNFITYKNWELSFFMFARVGQTIYKAAPNLQTRYVDVAVDYWTPYNTTAVYPSPSSSSDTYMSSLRYQDGSFLKVRNISLSYSVPKNVLTRLKMSKLAFKAQLVNPILITNAEHTDPDYLTPDAIKSVVFGINVGF